MSRLLTVLRSVAHALLFPHIYVLLSCSSLFRCEDWTPFYIWKVRWANRVSMVWPRWTLIIIFRLPRKVVDELARKKRRRHFTSSYFYERVKFDKRNI